MTTLDRLCAALRAEAESVNCCIAVACLDESTSDETRRAAADAAVTTYEAIAGVVDALMDVLAAAGAPGLLEALAANERQMGSVVVEAYGIPDARAAARASHVAEHAYDRARGRSVRVNQALVLPWLARQQEACDA